MREEALKVELSRLLGEWMRKGQKWKKLILFQPLLLFTDIGRNLVIFNPQLTLKQLLEENFISSWWIELNLTADRNQALFFFSIEDAFYSCFNKSNAQSHSLTETTEFEFCSVIAENHQL